MGQCSRFLQAMQGVYLVPNEVFSVRRAGQLDYGIALSTLDYLNKEDMYVPWKTALNRLSYLETVLDNRPAYGMLQVECALG